MILEGVILALVMGWLRGGRLKNLLNLNLKGLNLVILAMAMRYATIFLSRSIDFFFINGGIIQIAAYGVLFLGIWQSWQYIEFKAIGVGSFANFLAIAANGGKMPVSSSALNSAGLTLTETGTHILMNEGTKFAWLSDVIPLPPPYPLTMVISLGDIVILLGVMLLVQNAMQEDSGLVFKNN
ncbi:DUF5317 domain-containing protein [Candidatus Contubernalis alkaliaceticus]|uniref:DUF5317 domain-containing protein n=1 Tax=Candidatus Contubernalis alkaliaceticus TaxID=338645 RepID=UPI001F4C33EB|nr:DUF5317 domain-containing protein [Candidatus Contubernalis alkalaceticus]UNC90770.1 DUF5317 domain-containing protein [Candidatus Contubernalis alkalaceticus]